MIFVIVSGLLWSGCRAVTPSAAIIEKAKIETRSILDSLNRDESTIIANVKLDRSILTEIWRSI